ncbi:MAG: LTA synthase family protein, partial [Atopobiaceae bacterium]|nr:LTA synthase family protein [Atopobiaceae bacterium]
YATTAIHPNLPTNWNRESVYAQMGFDRFVTIQDFADAPTFHNGVTDGATYDEVLEVLASSDRPQFVFDVTMQNHSSYDKDDIPASRLTHYVPSDYDDSEHNAELNEYLSCIQASDEDLAMFVAALKELDRPVILVFFGDHQPYFTNVYNDALFAGEPDGPEHQARVYQTAYVIWANYDVAGNDQVGAVLDTSTGFLSSMLLDYMGAPLTSYQKAKLLLQRSVPAVFAYGYLTSDGSWHALNESMEPRDDLARIQYLEFALKVN